MPSSPEPYVPAIPGREIVALVERLYRLGWESRSPEENATDYDRGYYAGLREAFQAAANEVKELFI